MSIPQILALSLTEILGDYNIKQFANVGGIKYLGMGMIGYIGVFIMLIISMQGSTLLMVNSAWDGFNCLINSLFAYFILGERLNNKNQYLGIFLIIGGLFLLQIPLSKNTPFKWPLL